jgi:hypothetical protein
MEQGAINDVLARRFLLGELSPEEQGQFEALAFSDPDTFAVIQSAKDELIDDFIYRELSPQETRAFQDHFLAQPGRRQDVRIARALKRYLDEREPSSNVPHTPVNPPQKLSFLDWFRLRPVRQSLATATLVVAAASGLWLLIGALSRRDPSFNAQHQQTPLPTPVSSPTPAVAQASPSPSIRENPIRPSPSPQGARSAIATALLTPTSPVRSEDDAKEPPDSVAAETLSFELPVIESFGYGSYQVALQQDEKTIRQWPTLRLKQLRAGPGVLITVRPGLLKSHQKYRFVLTGRAANGQVHILRNYYFQTTSSQ